MKTTSVLLILASLAALGFVRPAAGDIADRDCGRDDPAYAGVKSCKTCHFAQWTSWKKTELAKSFDTLKPGQKADQKKKFNLDPDKDYTKDATCLPCHTTGYGKPGGYPEIVAGKEWSADEKKRAGEMEGVQCECCHGPGSLSGPYKKDHEDYKKADLVPLGLVEADKQNCETCHNNKSPTIAKDFVLDFDQLTKDREKIHKQTPLKHKH